MIKSSGYRISPTEVEEMLFQTGQIRQAAAIGIPDEVLGQTVKAFLVAKDGTALDCDDIQAYCVEKMPRHMVPKHFEIMNGAAEDLKRKGRLSGASPPGGLSDMQLAAGIEDSFPSSNGALLIGGVSAATLAEEFGTPLFVYDQSVMRRKWNAAAVHFSAHLRSTIRSKPIRT